MSTRTRRRIAISLVALVGLGLIAFSGYRVLVGSVLRQLTNGRLEGADYWSSTPAILSAGMGFDNIIGLPELTEDTVRRAGGSWNGVLTCGNGEEPATSVRTSAAIAGTINQAYKGYADYDDGLPVVFSWPVATETVDPTDFRFTLSTGDVVYGHAAGMNPNWENSERNTVVLFGDFGNRTPSSEPGAIFPVRLDIVADSTPLTLIGPSGREFNAVGLSWTTDTSPYDRGPVLVGAKLNRVGERPVGEGGVTLMDRAAYLPNDEFSLYSGGDHRLRVLTTGGFSPDGVTGLRPDMFEQFFRLHARGPDGGSVIMSRVGVDYPVAGGNLRILGLSDLGQAENHDEGIYYDGCYQEDRDNYIDIILAGEEAAARGLTFVEIPSLDGGYRAFYNPGGPGPRPFPGVRYSAPGPPDLEPVVNALDDPMRVTRDAAAQGPPWDLIVLILAVVIIGSGVVVIIFRRRKRSSPHQAWSRGGA
jgi:hypothetical protein